MLAEARPPAKPDPWSEAPLDLGWLRRADLALKLAAHSLAYGGWRLDAATASASVTDGVLTLQQLAGTLVGGSLSAYAQPCISGEIKRHFRDKRWQIHVRRSAQELLLELRKATEQLTHQLGRDPGDDERVDDPARHDR